MKINFKPTAPAASLYSLCHPWLKKSALAVSLLATLPLAATQFTGPAEWYTVNTNAVKKWQTAQTASPTLHVWRGVVADQSRGEVRFLVEAVGHAAGITTEFLVVGPLSDRAYESATVAIATPGDIVRAVESLGIKRGACIASRPFSFWPQGERFAATLRKLDHQEKRPLQTLLNDAERNDPLIGTGGIVFTGSRWHQDSCVADTNMPCSIISLYNAGETVFDVPFQADQSEVYGRLTLAEALPHGELLEITLAPLLPPDGKPRVLPLTINAATHAGKVGLTCYDSANRQVHSGSISNTLAWLQSQEQAGRDIFVTLALDDQMVLKQAAEVARLFTMLDGKGIKIGGKSESGLYPKAFAPQAHWRTHKGRHPQPFELHLTPNDAGGYSKKLIFIEEDWSVEGIDPALKPCEYPFNEWDELPALIEKTGGEDSKVRLLFVFAPSSEPLSLFMPGVRSVARRLDIVYIFTE